MSYAINFTLGKSSQFTGMGQIWDQRERDQLRVQRWYRIEIKGTHPLEKMKLLHIQNSTYNMNPHWAEVMVAI